MAMLMPKLGDGGGDGDTAHDGQTPFQALLAAAMPEQAQTENIRRANILGAATTQYQTTRSGEQTTRCCVQPSGRRPCKSVS